MRRKRTSFSSSAKVTAASSTDTIFIVAIKTVLKNTCRASRRLNNTGKLSRPTHGDLATPSAGLNF